jgi:hypothetical protein
MASIDVGIHPDPAGITTKHFPGGPPATFSTIEFRAGGAKVAAIFVDRREVLDALQAALDEIRADMDAAAGLVEDAARDRVLVAEWDTTLPAVAS